MFPFTVGGEHLFEQWLEPEVVTFLRRAVEEAKRMGMVEVTVALFLLLVCRDERLLPLLQALQLNVQALRERVSVYTKVVEEKMEEEVVPISCELKVCIDQAIVVVISNKYALLLGLEHILLSVLSSQKVRAWLGPLMPAVAVCREQLGRAGEAQGWVEIFEGLVRQDFYGMVHRHGVMRTLVRVEEPSTKLADVVGNGHAKRIVRMMMEPLFRRRAGGERTVERMETREVLLIGQEGKVGRQLAEATAGEMGCPLLSLIFTSMMALQTAYTTYRVERGEEEGMGLTALPLGIAAEGIALLKDLVQQFFAEVQQRSSAVVLIEDVDGLACLQVQAAREQLLGLLLEGMKALFEAGGQHIVIATARDTRAFDFTLYKQLHSSFFVQRVLLDEELLSRSGGQEGVCPGCHHRVQAGWRYCSYCGEVLARVCSFCGTQCMGSEEVHYCCVCGSMLN